MSAVLFSLLACVLVVVAAIDIKTKKISNKWSIFNLTFATILYILSVKNYNFDLLVLVYPLSFFLIGFILFLLNIMGAGDVKFISTFYFLIPSSLHSSFLNYLLISTICFALVLVLINIGRNFKKILVAFMAFDFKSVKSYFEKRFSYAPVILLAWCILGINVYLR